MVNQSLTHSYNKKAPLVGAFILSMQDSTIDAIDTVYDFFGVGSR